jgi:hypothetical protein
MRVKFSNPLLVLVFLLSVIILISCSNDNGDETSAIDPSSNDENYVYIVKDGVTDFYIVRSDFADKEVVNLAVNLRREIGIASGSEPGITTDWEKNPVYDHEIIIGKTLREANGVNIDRVSLGETGYIIKEDGGKIYISGGTEKGTALACDYFIENFVKSSKDIKIPVGYELIVFHQYDIPELYINMNLVDSSYRIIIPENSDKKIQEAAERLKQALYDKTGLMLEIKKGTADTEKAFVISNEVPEIKGIYDMQVDKNSLIFKSSAQSGVSGCVDRFIELYLKDKYGRFNFPSDFKYLDLGDYFIIRYPDSAKK